MPEPKDLPEGLEWSEGPKEPHRNKFRMGIAEDYPDLDMADDDVLAKVVRLETVAPGEWFEWGRNCASGPGGVVSDTVPPAGPLTSSC